MDPLKEKSTAALISEVKSQLSIMRNHTAMLAEVVAPLNIRWNAVLRGSLPLICRSGCFRRCDEPDER